MENTGNIIVVKKHSKLMKALKILLAVAAIAFVAAKIYQKFFQKKKLVAAETDDTPAVTGGETEEEQPAGEAFEVSADDVITNADELAESVAESAAPEAEA